MPKGSMGYAKKEKKIYKSLPKGMREKMHAKEYEEKKKRKK
jgi:hypothetical protein